MAPLRRARDRVRVRRGAGLVPATAGAHVGDRRRRGQGDRLREADGRTGRLRRRPVEAAGFERAATVGPEGRQGRAGVGSDRPRAGVLDQRTAPVLDRCGRQAGERGVRVSGRVARRGRRRPDEPRRRRLRHGQGRCAEPPAPAHVRPAEGREGSHDRRRRGRSAVRAVGAGGGEPVAHGADGVRGAGGALPRPRALRRTPAQLGEALGVPFRLRDREEARGERTGRDEACARGRGEVRRA